MSDAIGELLAVIHGDGGHYRAQHGTDKACLDALSIIYNLRAKPIMPSDEEIRKNLPPNSETYFRLIKAVLKKWGNCDGRA